MQKLNCWNANDYFAFVGPVRAEHKSKCFRARSRALVICLLLLFWLSDIAYYCSTGAYDGVIGVASANEQEDLKLKEYQLKAAFLFNFIKFVEWPDAGVQEAKDSSAPQEPFRIGIIGQDPFKVAFEGIQDKTVRNQKLEIIRLEGLSSFRKNNENNSKWLQDYLEKYQKQIQSCKVLFVCDSEKSFCKETTEIIGQVPALIVSDIENIGECGVVIGFINEENKIRFNINLTEAQKRNLKISSQLSRLARNVIGKETKKTDAQG